MLGESYKYFSDKKNCIMCSPQSIWFHRVYLFFHADPKVPFTEDVVADWNLKLDIQQNNVCERWHYNLWIYLERTQAFTQ